MEEDLKKICLDDPSKKMRPKVKKNQDVMYSDELRLALNKMFRQLLFNDKIHEYNSFKYFFIDNSEDTQNESLPLLR